MTGLTVDNNYQQTNFNRASFSL